MELVLGLLILGLLIGLAVSGRRSAQSRTRLSGKAYVIDGDSIRVKGYDIRLAGIDATEHGQTAVSWDGRTIDQGEIAKRVLIKKLRGNQAHVDVHNQDHYGRWVGTVWVEDRDICRELVREGVAWACFGEQYRKDQALARREGRGMWNNREMVHPGQWKRER